MTTIGPKHHRSPVNGLPSPQVTTQGVPQHDERVAVATLRTQVDPRDLDVFLKARAGEKQKGLAPSLKRLLDAPANAAPTDAVQSVNATIAQAVHELSTIYADGLVTENELVAIGNAQARLRSVLDLASPDVLNMLPRNVRDRLQQTLFEPLAILEAAADRRGDRVFAGVAARDEEALRAKLAEPEPRYALFSPETEARQGRPLVSAARFKAGDLVAVPRSDGRSTLGVVVDRDAEGNLRVEMIDERTNRFALKTVSPQGLLASNPLKIGDYLEVDDKQIWVKGVGRDGRLEAVVKQGPSVTTVGGDAFASIMQQASAQHAHATALEQLPAMQALPEVTRRLARFALDVGPSDAVFGRLSSALLRVLANPGSLGATAHEQAVALTKILRESPEHLHSVCPNFRTERALAGVSSRLVAQGAGAHPLFRMMPGTAAPGFAEHAVTFRHGDKSITLTVVEPQPRPAGFAERSAAGAPGKQLATMHDVVTNLAKLPWETLCELKNVVINPTPSPTDAFWQKEFNDPSHTAFMDVNKLERTVAIYPASGFAQMELSLAHEVGHIVSNARIGRASTPAWKGWDDAQKADNISVSRYAKNNLDEDFSETYSIYTMTKDTPAHAKYRGLMPSRFAFLDRLLA